MRTRFGFVLVGLSACSAQSTGPVQVPGIVAQGSAGPAPIAVEDAPVTGRLAPEIIQKTIRASFRKISPCYERVLVVHPDARGSTVTRFVIGGDGTVSDARTTLSGNLPPEMSACVEVAFRSFTFEAPSEGTVRVVYPIEFIPGK